MYWKPQEVIRDKGDAEETIHIEDINSISTAAWGHLVWEQTTEYNNFTHPEGLTLQKHSVKFFFTCFFLTTNELMDLGMDHQRLQISQETNTCCIMGEHNPM